MSPSATALECQRRTGSVLGAQARFPESRVVTVGASATYVRQAESGSTLSFHFCPACGSTVFYYNDALPGFLGVPLGAFADPDTWTPSFSVYERSKHTWVVPPTGSSRSRD